MTVSNFGAAFYTIGDGSIEKLREYQNERVGLVVDENIVKALGLDQVLYQDIFADTEYRVLCNVPAEPTIAMLEEPIRETRKFDPDRIIGIGGGAVMDTAKALWVFAECPDLTWDQALKPYQVPKTDGRIKLTVVPTTSGTGSETTGCSVLKDKDNRKRMILSKEIIPSEAILDFTLLRSLPLKNIAYSGTDALAHALEAAVSLRSNSLVREICIQAAVVILKNLRLSYEGDLKAREKVHIAASMAGMGIGNAGTGMAHGMDQAGGDFHLPHGLMTGLALPYTMQYLMPQPVYTEVAEQLGYKGTDEEKQKRLIGEIFDMYKAIGMPVTLKEADVPKEGYLGRISSYVERALPDANIKNCPKDPAREELERLYEAFYTGMYERKDG